jgi:hypothetical protein
MNMNKDVLLGLIGRPTLAAYFKTMPQEKVIDMLIDRLKLVDLQDLAVQMQQKPVAPTVVSGKK